MPPDRPPPGYPDDATQQLPQIQLPQIQLPQVQLPQIPLPPVPPGSRVPPADDATQLLPQVQLPPVPPLPPGGTQPPSFLDRQRLAIAGAMVAALVLVAVPLVAIQLSSTSPPTSAGAAAGTAPVVTAGAPASAAAPGPASPAPGQDARAMAPTPSASPAATSAPPARSEPAPSEPAPASAPPAGPWSITVDNSSTRFTASGNWKTSTDSGQRYGSDYRYASPVEASDPAWYRLDIPATGRYRVEVWFPANVAYNERTPYIVATTSGNQTIHISQRTGGGSWVNLGTFELAAGDANVVAVSRWRTAGTGYLIADAVRLTRV